MVSKVLLMWLLWWKDLSRRLMFVLFGMDFFRGVVRGGFFMVLDRRCGSLEWFCWEMVG